MKDYELLGLRPHLVQPIQCLDIQLKARRDVPTIVETQKARLPGHWQIGLFGRYRMRLLCLAQYHEARFVASSYALFERNR